LQLKEQKKPHAKRIIRNISKNVKREIKKTTMMVVLATYNYPNS
jgi:hypothetical protein